MLALSQAGPLKPEIKLQQALREYESLLTKDQRLVYQARVASRRVPDMSDVIQATSEIDREARKQRSLHRCSAPRLTKILTACQRFAAIGDIVVGGSQNMIACGVWSAVRLSLQISVSSGAFFDKLSLLVMDMGRTAPINHEIGLLVPDSPGLQSLIAEYMIRVVSICREIVKMTNKSSLLQIASTLTGFDAQFGQLSEEAKTIGHVIDRQVVLLSAKTGVSEARENQLSRVLLRGFSSEARRQAREVKAVRFFQELCKNQQDFDETCANVRQKGTVGWVFKHPDYAKWKGDPSVGTLNLVGKLGSGKSVVLANIVDDLHLIPESGQKVRPAVAYIFSTHGHRQLSTARQLVGSLALQILRSSPIRQLLDDYLDDHQLTDLLHLTLDGIIDTTATILSSTQRPPSIFMVLDGLEECAKEHVDSIRRALIRWSKYAALRLIFSSRTKMDIFDKVSPRISHISTLANSDDLAGFISSEVKKRSESRHLSADLCLLVTEVLTSGADGMFLWASLMLDLLFPTHFLQQNELAIRDLLEELPETLSEVYDRLLARVEDTDSSRRLFQLVAAAHRPLTLGEARDALSMKPGASAREPVICLSAPIELLHRFGGNILLVEEEDQTIQFIHDSALSHLLRQTSGFGFEEDEATNLIAEVCVSYLSLPELQGRLQKATLDAGSLTLPTNDLAVRIIQAALPIPAANPAARSLLSRINRSRQSRHFDLARVINGLVAASETLQEHIFLEYAQKYWLEHTKGFRINAYEAHPLWMELMSSRGTLSFPWDVDNISLLKWSLQHEHPSALAYALEHVLESPNNPSYKQHCENTLLELHSILSGHPASRWRGFREAAKYGDALELVIRIADGARIDTHHDKAFVRSFTSTILFIIPYFVKMGYAIDGMRMGREIDVEVATTPLGAACQMGLRIYNPGRQFKEAVFRQLLDCGADPNHPFETRTGGSRTLPLIYMAQHHHHADPFIEILSDAGANVNATIDSQPYCALTASWDSAVPNLTLQELLKRGADLNATVAGMTVIQHLVLKKDLPENEVMKILDFLCGNDVDLNQTGNLEPRPALQLAFLRPAPLLVRFFIERGVDWRYLVDEWETPSYTDASNPLSNEVLSLALELDGIFPVQKDLNLAEGRLALVNYGRHPTRAPDRSVMLYIYERKSTLLNQRIRLLGAGDTDLINKLLHWIVAFGNSSTLWSLGVHTWKDGRIKQCPWLLHRAVLTAHLTGDTSHLDVLLSSGRDIDEPGPRYGETPLFWAIWLGNKQVAAYLLGRGASNSTALSGSFIPPSAVPVTFGPTLVASDDVFRVEGGGHLHHHLPADRPDCESMCPLLTAVLVADLEMIQLLIKSGASMRNHFANSYLERVYQNVLRDRPDYGAMLL